jgi:SAM-dependent MidA family methyltransferase
VIKFSEYFHNWLYDKDGYYANYKAIGKEGDFFTAVSTSSFFGGSIAKRIIDTIESGFVPKTCSIVEVGAHHGYLMADIIQFIYTLKPKLLKSLEFVIVERFDTLQTQQIRYLKESFGDAIRLNHFKSLDEVQIDNAIVVANEIFDAFACEMVYTKDGILQQAFVDEKKHKIKFLESNDTNIIKMTQKYKITKGEIPLGFDSFATSLANNINRFEFITFDYGDEYPRNDFSCRVYSKHEVFPIFQGMFESVDINNQKIKDGDILDFAKLYKKSDITYDVNFAYLIDCFKDAGVDNISYETQLKALVNFGIIDLLEILHDNADEKTYLHESNKVKTLLEPTGMGDRFKCAVFRKE